MTDQTFTQLGVSGVIVVLLVVIMRALWADNQALRTQAHEDQAAMLPALTASSAALLAATTAIERVTRLVERRASKGEEPW